MTALLHGQTITDALRGLLEQMRTTADELAAERIAARDAAFDRSFLVQVIAMPAAIVAAMILMVGFTAGMVRRVDKMRNNAKRLDREAARASPTPRRDELGSLSRALVRTGRISPQLQEELRQLATVDELTGLANRRGFFALGEHQLLVAARTRSAVALLFVDVDGLKRVNDELGHADGRPVAQGGRRRDPRDDPQIRSRRAASAATSSACSSMGDPELDPQRAWSGSARRPRTPQPATRADVPGVALDRPLRDPPGPSVTLEELIDAADEGMYEDKRAEARSAARLVHLIHAPSLLRTLSSGAGHC